MKFLTGSETIAPMGSPQKIRVFFKHDCVVPAECGKCNCYPTISTCAFNLTIPVHITSDDMMKDVFALALQYDQGFGRC